MPFFFLLTYSAEQNTVFLANKICEDNMSGAVIAGVAAALLSSEEKEDERNYPPKEERVSSAFGCGLLVALIVANIIGGLVFFPM